MLRPSENNRIIRLIQNPKAALCVLGMAAVVATAGCKTQNYRMCTPGGQPSSRIWNEYRLPAVEGAEFCRELGSEVQRGTIYIHYHQGDRRHYIDYFKDYYDGFVKDGWTINLEDRSDKFSRGLYVEKNGKHFHFSLGECLAQGMFERPCSEAELWETSEAILRELKNRPVR